MFGPEVGGICTETCCPVSTWLTGICSCAAVVINFVCIEITYKEFHVTNKKLFGAYRISKFWHSHGCNESNYDEQQLEYQGLTRIIQSKKHSANLKSQTLFGKQIIIWF
jgi:hypothetical protein